ncbi:class I SAM-dependent methyltransferase [Sciscionella marina]|uniref:class I SAM-dependent methyltransferase n=1 Tax=Sciscionella marina TaxID=508770 RepID=UPI00036ED630|nr:class I SAM-dependent methyltransferase [Sciscionella marina]
MPESEYLFDTGSESGRQHVTGLDLVLGRKTAEFLGTAGILPGQRCLELGAGSGSVANWMADRTGPDGTVVAVDLETDHLLERPGIEIYRHDINDGLPVPGPFDVIHARLVLVHLPRREEIFEMLVDALAPGGWLVLGEVVHFPQSISAPSTHDEAIFAKVWRIAAEIVGPAADQDYRWGHRVYRRMAAAELHELHAEEFSETAMGGDPHGEVLEALVRQAEPPLAAAGCTPDELARLQELLRDPLMRYWFFRLVYTRGRKPC